MATVKGDQPTAVPEAESAQGNGPHSDDEKSNGVTKDGKVELQESDAWDKLGYSFPTWRKW